MRPPCTPGPPAVGAGPLWVEDDRRYESPLDAHPPRRRSSGPRRTSGSSRVGGPGRPRRRKPSGSGGWRKRRTRIPGATPKSPAVAVVILSSPCAPPGSAPEWVFSPCRSSLRGARLGYSLRGRDRQRHVGGQLLLADRARAMRPYYRLIAPGTMPRPGSYRVPTAPIFAVVEFIPANSRIRYTLSNPVQCEPRK